MSFLEFFETKTKQNQTTKGLVDSYRLFPLELKFQRSQALVWGTYNLRERQALGYFSIKLINP